MGIIEVQLGEKDRERLGVTGQLLLDEEDLLDLTFERVVALEAAFGMSMPLLLGSAFPQRTAQAKKALAFLALERAGINVGAYAKFEIAPNRCHLFEVQADAADAVPPSDSSSTFSEDSPPATGSPRRSRGRGAN